MKCMRGRGKKAGVFSPKTSYKLGTDDKQGEQVGFLTVLPMKHGENRTKYLHISLTRQREKSMNIFVFLTFIPNKAQGKHY